MIICSGFKGRDRMKKILTAMGNDTLNKELMKYSKYDLITDDLFYQEAVLDVMKEEKCEVLIVSSLLQGQLEFYDFIVRIHKMDSLMRIIVIADEVDSFFKRKMNDLGIVDIYLDSTVSFEEIIDSIDREEPISRRLIHSNSIEKVKVEEKEKQKYVSKNDIENTPIVVEEVTQKQEIIVVTGINGAGKTTITANFSKVLAKKTSSKILLIDLDTFSGNLDEILDITKIPLNVDLMMDNDKKCGLNYAVELISKNRFDSNVFDELVVNIDGIDVLTGNTSLYYCQNVLNENHYKTILETAKEKYDFIIIDTSSNIFLDSVKWSLQQASKVFFVTENNYISMKKTNQLIEIFTNNWKIWKNKIEIIVNKERLTGIDLEVINKIFNNYKIIGSIKNGEENEENSYIKILETIKYIPKVNLINKIFQGRINSKTNYKINKSEVI